MAAGLQPAVELAMMSQRHVLTGGVHHDGAGGQVGVLNGAIKGRLVRVDKRANLGEVGRFSGVLGHVGRQLLGQGRPCSASRTSRRFSSVRRPAHAVRISGPSSVMATVCSKCADTLASAETTVQPSASVFVFPVPRFTIGSMAITVPTLRRMPVSALP